MNFVKNFKNQLLSSKMVLMLAAAIVMGGFFVANNALAAIVPPTVGTLYISGTNSGANMYVNITSTGGGDITKCEYTKDNGVNWSNLSVFGNLYCKTDSVNLSSVTNINNIKVRVTSNKDVNLRTSTLITETDSSVDNVDAGIDHTANALFAQDATATDNKSGIAKYEWIRIGGPSGQLIIASNNSEDTTISAKKDDNYVIQLTVTDNVGNQFSDTFNLVWDTIKPVVALKSSNPVAVGYGSAYSDAGATASDNIDGDLTSKIVTVNPVNTSVVGSYVVTYNVKDAAGNSAVQKTRTINVVDTVAPVIAAHENITAEAESAAGAVVEYSLPTANDAVDGDVAVVCLPASGLLFSVGDTTVNCSATDKSGNKSASSFSVTVQDKTAPVIVLNGAAKITLEKGSSYVEAGATWTDAVDGTGAAVVGGVVDTGIVGTYEIKYNYADKAGNAAEEKSAIITVEDTIAPAIYIGDYSTEPTNGDVVVTATTDEDGTLNETSYTFTENGSFTFVSTDSSGNSSSLTVVISNIDKTAPTGKISYDVTVPTNGVVVATLLPSEKVKITNNDGSEKYTFTANGSFTFEFIDAAGNIGSAVATVENIDTLAPIITIGDYSTSTTNQDIVVTASTEEDAILNESSHTFTVNGSFEFVATDSVGNVATKTVTIINIDKVAPVITLRGEAEITLNFGAEYVEQGAECLDDVDGLTEAIFSGQVDVNSAGTYKINYNCSDKAGNKADEKTRTVIVNEKEAEPVSGNGGGLRTVSYCSEVVYDEWQACNNGVQYRNILSQTPNYCSMTSEQQAGRSRSCNLDLVVEQKVLGVKTYADGTLLRGSDKKVYIVVNGKLRKIADVKELGDYAGKEIIDVSQAIIDSFPKVAVLGVKKYGLGQLIRNGDVKVYVITQGLKKHILNLEELAKYYFGKTIYKVTREELDLY